MNTELSTDVLGRIGSVQGEVSLAPRPWKNDLGFVILLVLGAIGAVIGVGVLSKANGDGDRAMGITFAAIGGLLLAGGVALFLKRKARFGTISLGETGLAITRGSRTDAIAFAEIDRLVAFDKAVYANGVAAGIDWRIEAAGRGGRVNILAWSAGGENDALDTVYGYVLAKTADAWDRRRKAGETLTGKGFRLDASGLQTPKTGVVPLSDLRFGGIYDGAVSLWRGADSEPFLKVPTKEANATLLLILAKRAMPENAREDTSTNGRVLFSRSPSRGLVIFCGLIVASVAGGAVVALLSQAEIAVVGSLAVTAALLGLGIGWMWQRRFRCFERAVELRGLFSTRTLRFDELVGYDHGAVRMYHNGAYTGTNVTFAFHPEQGKSLTYGTQFQGGDADFERLHQHITGIVAERLFDRIRREGLEVQWGKDARITREGLVFFAHKLIGRGPEVRLAWTETLQWSMNEGQFTLNSPMNPSADLRMAASSRNFYPGLLLVQRLAEAARTARSA